MEGLKLILLLPDEAEIPVAPFQFSNPLLEGGALVLESDTSFTGSHGWKEID